MLSNVDLVTAKAESAQLEGKGSPVPSPTASPSASPQPMDDVAMKKELQIARDLVSLPPTMQDMFQLFFDRYDISENGRLDSKKELIQLITNLMFSLKLSTGITQLLEEAEKVGEPDWDVHQFTAWFLPRVQDVMRNQSNVKY